MRAFCRVHVRTQANNKSAMDPKWQKIITNFWSRQFLSIARAAWLQIGWANEITFYSRDKALTFDRKYESPLTAHFIWNALLTHSFPNWTNVFDVSQNLSFCCLVHLTTMAAQWIVCFLFPLCCPYTALFDVFLPFGYGLRVALFSPCPIFFSIFGFVTHNPVCEALCVLSRSACGSASVNA